MERAILTFIWFILRIPSVTYHFIEHKMDEIDEIFAFMINYLARDRNPSKHDVNKEEK